MPKNPRKVIAEAIDTLQKADVVLQEMTMSKTYIERPRCGDCRFWVPLGKVDSDPWQGRCKVLSHDLDLTDGPAKKVHITTRPYMAEFFITTLNDFGCTEWQKRS